MLEPRMPKLGIRGTATGRFAMQNMAVPKENILGPLGKGLRVALTVLDFGRTTFGACCTGGAKTCLRLAVEHANKRKQFKKTLGEFDLVKKKIARMAADVYAMEAMTVITASLIDRGLEDYMMETAMLKVFTTERLWEAVNDAFQIHGGSAYFNDSPLERMLRDARINQIGEGSNEVLTSFVALVGMRGPGMEFKEILDTMLKPWRRDRMKAWGAGLNRLGAAVKVPTIPVKSERLRASGRTARAFDLEVQSRGQPRAHSIPRADPRHAARPGANRQFGHGNVCFRLRPQPARFGAAGCRQEWRIKAGQSSRGGVISSAVIWPHPPVPRGSEWERRQGIAGDRRCGARQGAGRGVERTLSIGNGKRSAAQIPGFVRGHLRLNKAV